MYFEIESHWYTTISWELAIFVLVLEEWGCAVWLCAVGVYREWELFLTYWIADEVYWCIFALRVTCAEVTETSFV